MRLLVTGAGGFLGSNLLDLIVDQGAEVHAIHRGTHPDRSEVRWHRADLFDADAVETVLDRIQPTHLCHLAWLGPEHADRYRAAANADWAVASRRLFDAFRRVGGERLVNLGSCIEYGNRAEGVRTEAQPLAPDTAYGHAKAELSAYVEQLGADLSTAVARPFFAYGPYEQVDRLVPSIVLALARGESIALTEGRQRRDYLHASEVAAALWCLLTEPVEGAFNVGSGVGVEVRSVAETLGLIAGRPELLEFGARPEGADTAAEIVADIERITGATSWRPTVGLEAGLAHAAIWWTRWWSSRSAASSSAGASPQGGNGA